MHEPLRLCLRCRSLGSERSLGQVWLLRPRRRWLLEVRPCLVGPQNRRVGPNRSCACQCLASQKVASQIQLRPMMHCWQIQVPWKHHPMRHWQIRSSPISAPQTQAPRIRAPPGRHAGRQRPIQRTLSAELPLDAARVPPLEDPAALVALLAASVPACSPSEKF